MTTRPTMRCSGGIASLLHSTRLVAAVVVMRHELIVLPKAAHARIAEAIRSSGIEVELCEDKSIQRHRHPGDSLYLCRHGKAAVELLVPGENELPEKFGDYTCVIFFHYGGFMRQFRHRAIEAKLQQFIGGILHQLKMEY